MWARKGYSAAEIQKEMDVKYDELLTKSHEVQKEAKLGELIARNLHDLWS